MSYSGFFSFFHPIVKMVLNVLARADQSLLLGVPQGDADRPARLDADGLQDAEGLDGDGAAGPVVRGPGPGMPGIEMAAQHDDFALELFVRAREFGHDVVTLRVLVGEGGVDLDLHRHRDVLLQDADQAVVMLDGDDDGRKRRGRVQALRTAAGHEHRAVLALAGLQRDGGAFVLEELVDSILEQHAGLVLFHAARVRRPGAGLGGVFQALQFGLGVTMGHGFERDRQVLLALGQDDGALELLRL